MASSVRPAAQQPKPAAVATARWEYQQDCSPDHACHPSAASQRLI